MYKIFYPFLLVFFFSSNTIWSKIVITNNTYTTDSNIYRNIEYLIPKKDLRLDQVRHYHFTPLSQDRAPNFGLQAHGVWLKFKVAYQDTSSSVGFALNIANPLLTVANLYIIDTNGRIDSTIQGNQFPFSKRIIQSPDFIYRLLLNNQEPYTCYMRLESGYPLILPVSINSLRAQFNSSAADNAIALSFAGILIVMILYNGFIALSTKASSYWYYIVFLLFLGLSQLSLNGFTYMLLWPESPEFNNISVILFSDLAGISVILFSYSFLSLRAYGNNLIHTLFGVIMLGLISSLILISTHELGFAFYTMQLSTLVGALILLIVAVFILRKNKNAIFFLLAWITLLFSSLIFVLKDYNIISNNMLVRHIVQLGSVIEVIVLSIGLADRINRLKDQRDYARKAELLAVTENQMILNSQNTLLNQKVEERTVALSEANSKLSQSLIELQQAQTQLVESEKMTSLGQLTAGIAHEINNPINFVSSSISPLRRDIEQLFDAIGHIESIGLDKNKKPIIKLKEMAAYKEGQDLDYIKTEINHLLKGVHDGASRTAEIVKGLRIFSHIDDNSFTPSNINEGLQSTLSVSSSLLKDIEVTTQLGELPLVPCFPGKLNQVFLNIITNAAYAVMEKHSKGNGGAIWISTKKKDDKALISIKDNGTGMSEETKRKVFEPFFTTKAVGKGTGLGMSISFSILKQHSAACTILSELGKGSEFLIEIPINPPVSPENASETDYRKLIKKPY